MVLTIDAASGSACTLNGSTVTFTAVGSCVIDANQAGTAGYAPAAQVQQQITVGTASGSSAPVITSAAGYTVPAGQSFSFTVTTTGNPTPTLKISGSLPSGVGFNANSNGTATISGTARRSRTYRVTITASNGVGRSATQNFTLTIS